MGREGVMFEDAGGKARSMREVLGYSVNGSGKEFADQAEKVVEFLIEVVLGNDQEEVVNRFFQIKKLGLVEGVRLSFGIEVWKIHHPTPTVEQGAAFRTVEKYVNIQIAAALKD